MLKKIGAAIIAAAMSVTGLCSIPYAEGVYETYINTQSGLTVTNSEINYIPGRNISVKFNVENNSEKDEECNILVDIENKSFERVAHAAFSRQIKAGESVPVSFGSANHIEEEKLNITISVYKPGVETEIYVSPSGNDNNEGSYEEPLKTVEGAVAKVNQMNTDERYNAKDISVIFKDGRYNIADTVTISEDITSNLSSLTLKTIGANTVFYGGVSVKGSDFTKVTDENVLSMFSDGVSGKIYSLNLSDYGITTNFADGTKAENDPIFTLLYYNGKTEQIAKYPNDGYALGTSRIGSDAENKKTTVKSPDIKDWQNYDEAWLRGWLIWEWDLIKGRIANIAQTTSENETDETITGRTLTLQQLFAGSVPDKENRPATYQNKEWYVYNLPQELDIEGEYAIIDNVLYYYPSDEDVASGEFSKASILVNTDSNDMLSITSADKVTIEGITFENSGGYFVNVKSDNFTLIGCEFRNSSRNAVTVTGYNNIVSSCDFHDLGGQGLNLGGGDRNTLTDSNSVVQNCYFNKTGQINRTNCSALSLSGCGATARRNTITNTPHLALSYNGNNHIIEYNDIYNCLTDNAGDAGLIYTGNNLSNQGTVIRKNYLHDSNSGLGAIYWDDRLSGQNAEENVFENVNRALLIHGGVCNKFNSNIIINASYGLQVRSKGRMAVKEVTYVNSSGETVTENKSFNMWDTAPMMPENKGTANGYNPYGNVFLGSLVGVYHNYTSYPIMPWEGEIWQKAYGNVLKYVNNKTDDKASETEFSGNYFVNSQNEIYPYAGMTSADLTVNSENITGQTELTAQMQAKYNDVTNNSGIYADGYRTIE